MTGTDSGTALFNDASWYRYQPTLSEAGSEKSTKITLAVTYTHDLMPKANACMSQAITFKHYTLLISKIQFDCIV